MVEGHTQAFSSISLSMVSDVPSSSTVFLVIWKTISRRTETVERHPHMFYPGCSNIVCVDSQHFERRQGIGKDGYAGTLCFGCECLLVDLSSPSAKVQLPVLRSLTLTWCPCALNAMAVARPPMLPPAIRTCSPSALLIGPAFIFGVRSGQRQLFKERLDNRVAALSIDDP